MNKTSLKKYEDFGEEAEYRSAPFPSVSTLKLIKSNLPSFLSGKESKREDWITLGQLVDILITDSSNVDKRILVSDFVMGSSQIKVVIEELVNRGISLKNKEKVLSLCRELNFRSNMKDDSLFNLVVRDGKEYYNLLLESRDKIVTSSKDFEVAKTMALTTKVKLRNLKKKRLERVDEEIFQYKAKETLPIDFKPVVKGMLDMVWVDHKNKVIQCIDIKTGHYWDFNYALYKFELYYQAALYNTIMRLKFEKLGYEVKPFLFVYTSTQYPNYAIAYEFPANLEDLILYKGYKFEKRKDIIPLINLIDTYYHYKVKNLEVPEIMTQDKINEIVLSED